ncbi:hypothetical protein RFI_06801 [Reticulomyxa filosa]|uniref:Uncharacterized protein n=1 Tax=Reticulomyxa filosa TaxID=46433 RepID=X6NWW3_RETFI|nr:hypothetical protein RFI_06801 [Reticulomyxa filosa]|eukprot:ETO30319.1 hypothetical protein RFI_06801 [Reticulomyxa filosa]
MTLVYWLRWVVFVCYALLMFGVHYVLNLSSMIKYCMGKEWDKKEGFSSRTRIEEIGERYEKEMKEKIIMITGGTDGIGKEVIKEMIKRKVKKIIMIYRKESKKKMEKIIKEYDKNKDIIIDIECDLSCLESIEECINKIKKMKEINKIDILINNAGILQDLFLFKQSNQEEF